jgi:hypothetical protein
MQQTLYPQLAWVRVRLDRFAGRVNGWSLPARDLMDSMDRLRNGKLLVPDDGTDERTIPDTNLALRNAPAALYEWPGVPILPAAR